MTHPPVTPEATIAAFAGTSNPVSPARSNLMPDVEGNNAEYTTPPKIADLLAWADNSGSF